MIDKIPNSCDECEVRCTGYTAKDYAQKGIKKPSWCPIRPLPEKRNYSDELADTRGFDMYMEGWNDCLKEITDEDNKNVIQLDAES